MKKLEHGRSMVEMLGVLAIIGVLSVGAIAGYQKAMFKYKLNKQAQQLNQVINTVAINWRHFAFSGHVVNILPYFVKLGDIPKEMITGNDDRIIYDIFKTPIKIYSSDADTEGEQVVEIWLNPQLQSDSKQNLEICKNIILTAKEYHDDLYTVSTVSDNDAGDGYNSLFMYGDKICRQGYTCLKNITLDDIYKLCTNHIKREGVHFKISWYTGI